MSHSAAKTPQDMALEHRATAPWAFPLDLHTLEVTVRAPRGCVDAVTARHGDRYDHAHATETPLRREGEDARHVYWRAALPAPTRRARYVFRAEGAHGTVWLGADGPRADAEGVRPFEVPYIHPSSLFSAPAWLDDAVFYQVFPDRFRNGNPANDPPGALPWGAPLERGAVYGGDLEGIRLGLPYLRGLGVTALYTTPIFTAPSNHKYDTTDYETVDPAFGTADDLRALSHALHAAGMRLVLDGVFNHSGREWFAFQDVRARGAASPYAGWFQNVRFPVDVDTVNYETFAVKVGRMPKLNTDQPGLREYLLDVAARWTADMELDGWRLDVGNEVSPAFWRAFRERVRAVNPDAFLLLEAWTDALDFLRGDTFDAATNYPWRNAALDFLRGGSSGGALLEEMTRVRMLYPSVVSHACVHLLGSHDTPRIRTEAGSAARALMGAVLLFTSPGVPLVYYGDEVGLEGGNDPDCRRCFPWDDPAARDQGIEDAYRRLIALRRAHPWLRRCGWRPRLETGAAVCAFTALDGETPRIDVLLNRGGTPEWLDVDGPWESVLDGRHGEGAFLVPPESAAVLVRRSSVPPRS